jgi:hypothetical protein
MASDLERGRAYASLKRAIKAGALTRPSYCEKCGVDPGTRTDGRSLVQAHHDDYDKPLEVQWLCPSCHRAETPWASVGERNGAYTKPERILRGEYHGRAKVNAEQVMQMRLLHAAGVYGSYQLGKIFGLAGKTVRGIVRRESWRHV